MEVSSSLKHPETMADVYVGRRGDDGTRAYITHTHSARLTDFERRPGRGVPAFDTLIIQNGSFGSVVMQMELESGPRGDRQVFVGECNGEALDHLCVVQVRRTVPIRGQGNPWIDVWYLTKDGKWAVLEDHGSSPLAHALPDDAFRIPLPELAPDAAEASVGAASA